ncbi:MAG: DUF389 domain-containing protein [Acidimicrobiia bacterium]
MLQVRVVSPTHLTDQVITHLRGEHGATNITVHAGAALEPSGDLVVVDIARERGNAVVEDLVALELDRLGSISVLTLEASTSLGARHAEDAAIGHELDAILWEALEENSRSDAGGSVTFAALMVLAALIACVGVLLDSPVLIIGAMIVGPEYGPITSLSVALYRRRPYALAAAATLAWGLAAAVATSALATVVFRAVGEVPDGYQPSERFFTAFVTTPNVFSVVVALAAGVAGTIALAQGRQAALAGVLVSVATIPAAAALGVDIVFASWSDAGGAAAQLGLNVAAIIAASICTLAVHDRTWRRVDRANTPIRT